MQKALDWWESLTDEGRASFPKPKSTQDIINYYNNPADYIPLEYGML